MTIPASAIVSVSPSVLTAGGDALDLNGLFLTTNVRPPIGTVQSFASLAGVSAYFGASANETTEAAVYFAGFTGATAVPGALLFSQYNTAAVSAYLRGGAVSSLTLAQLQAISGTLTVVIDGITDTAAALNLATATSFSSAAGIIGSALGVHGVSTAALTGCTITGTTLTVGGVTSGSLAVGDVLSGTGITAGTYITALVSGTGGAGTYTVSPSQNMGSSSLTAYLPGVTYDSVSGAFIVTSGTTGIGSTIGFATGTTSATLALTAAAGAVTSQGAAIMASPSAAMNAIIALTQNWATFTTLFDPDTSGNANKLLFAAWTSQQNDRYLYAAWDTDVTPTNTVPATASLGYLLGTNADSGTAAIYEPSNLHLAAFLMGAVAAIDFSKTQGRATMAFKNQGGLSPSVTDQTVGADLISNGYNFYGSYATANEQFTFFYPGSVSGPFKWIDAYVNQIWMNSQFQLALMNLLTNVKSVPYNPVGYGLIAAALQDPINAALNFGAIQSNVTLSAAQVAEVNAAAGKVIAPILQTRGWYLLIQDAAPSVRAARGSPPCTFFYTDGGSVQKISLASIDVM